MPAFERRYTLYATSYPTYIRKHEEAPGRRQPGVKVRLCRRSSIYPLCVISMWRSKGK